MTHKEENIVNIAMRAAELLVAGKIERDELTGHAGLTDTIIALADKFEKQNAGVDFDAEGRDYWEEIDAFAEEHLLEIYGIEQSHETKQLDIKVIIDEGIVQGVLKNDNIPVDVEIVDIDPDYEDYEALDDYRNQLYKDKSYSNCDYTVAHFDEEELGDLEPEFEISGEHPVTVYAVSAGVKHAVFSGDFNECSQFCEDNEWVFMDENEFEWDLEMEDSREELFPEDYFAALDHYSKEAGLDIENEFVRQHAEELVYCYHNETSLIDFDWWTQYETVLNEKLTFEEYLAIDDDYPGDPMEITSEDIQTLTALREALTEFRERDPHLFTCIGDKEFMFLVKAVDKEDAERTGEAWYTETFFEPGRFDCWNTNKQDYENLSTNNCIESKAYQKMLNKEKPAVRSSLNDLISNADAKRSTQQPQQDGKEQSQGR